MVVNPLDCCMTDSYNRDHRSLLFPQSLPQKNRRKYSLYLPRALCLQRERVANFSNGEGCMPGEMDSLDWLDFSSSPFKICKLLIIGTALNCYLYLELGDPEKSEVALLLKCMFA